MRSSRHRPKVTREQSWTDLAMAMPRLPVFYPVINRGKLKSE